MFGEEPHVVYVSAAIEIEAQARARFSEANEHKERPQSIGSASCKRAGPLDGLGGFGSLAGDGSEFALQCLHASSGSTRRGVLPSSQVREVGRFPGGSSRSRGSAHPRRWGNSWGGQPDARPCFCDAVAISNGSSATAGGFQRPCSICSPTSVMSRPAGSGSSSVSASGPRFVATAPRGCFASW